MSKKVAIMDVAAAANSEFDNSIEPFLEMAAYEALWKDTKVSFKAIAEVFASHPGQKPSEFVSENLVAYFQSFLKDNVLKGLKSKPGVLINNTYDYPSKLRDAEYPVELLYYRGDLSLLSTRSIAIVGTRNPTADGLSRTRKLVKLLVDDGFTIASGLAYGIDTQAHQAAIANRGKTFAVIGTPITETYPKENKDLQEKIARDFLLVSQVPFWRYRQQDFRTNRFFFPERNKTMSALTEGTVIIEASETSGTLIQAKAALQQGRKLFILESCFQNKNISWPKKFEALGAVRVRDYSDIKNALTEKSNGV